MFLMGGTRSHCTAHRHDFLRFLLVSVALGCGLTGVAQNVHVTPKPYLETPPSSAASHAASQPAQPAMSFGTQPPSPSQLSFHRPKAATFSTEAQLVLVPVIVTDPRDRLVTGLGRRHFRVFEDKKPVKISSFSSQDAPISVGVIFDNSESMSDKIQKSREAVDQFFRTANPQDEFMLVAFADEPHLLCDFTNNLPKIESEVDFTPPHGRTSLLDAIYLGLDRMREARYNRKALLIISDGGDNHSRYTESEIRNFVRESDVQIYAIGIYDPAAERMTPEEQAGPALLNDLAESSGGRAFSIHDPDELPDVAERIAMELRNEYVIGYKPLDQRHDGKWRKIMVKLKPPAGLPPLTVYAKRGYYGPNP